MISVAMFMERPSFNKNSRILPSIRLFLFKLAKGFKEAGTPIAVIAQVTGLSIEEIEKL
jgi:hypothetical protein